VAVKIQVTLYAGLQQYLPVGASGRSVSLEVAAGTTAAQAMRLLGMPEDLPCIPVVNGQRVDLGTELSDGEALGLFPPLAGGAGVIQD
jgi:sulfur-carrier protein